MQKLTKEEYTKLLEMVRKRYIKDVPKKKKKLTLKQIFKY